VEGAVTGTYTLNAVLTDNNETPLSTSYKFKLYIDKAIASTDMS
jgi:hypothetical protein